MVWSDLVGAWLVTKHELIAAIATDTFSSRMAAPPLDEILPPDVLAIMAEAGPPGTHMVQADPPDHARLRHIGEQVLSGPLISATADYMRTVSNELLDRAEPDGSIELVSQHNSPNVHSVLNRLVGIPDADMARVDEWNNAFLGLMAPTTPHETKRELARQYVAYQQYLTALLEARREAPRNVMTSTLAGLYPKEDMTWDQALPHMRMFLCGLFAGGIHTTKDAITSAVRLSLSTDGGAPWRRMVEDQGEIRNVLLETLRREAPHRGLTRVATRDTTIADVHIKEGEQVMLLFGAANLDPAAFDATEALTVLVQRLPTARLVQPEPVWSAEFYFRGLEHLHLTR